MNLPLFNLPLLERRVFTFVRVLLGVIYCLAGVMLVKIYFETPLYNKDGVLNGVYTDGFYIILVSACLFLSYGLLAKKEWVLTLYWTCCGFWDLLVVVGFCFWVGNFNERHDPLEAFVYMALFLGPILIGLFLLRHRDHFTPGFLPQALARRSADQEPSHLDSHR